MASSCVLRAAGDNFQPFDFLRDSPFQPCQVYCKGSRRSASTVWQTSGMTVDVSTKDQFSEQVQDAVFFLENNLAELVRLKQFNGLTEMRLDFGVNEKGSFLQTYVFPLELICLAGELALELELSIYATQ